MCCIKFQVLIVERLFSSSLVALVQRASPRKLRVGFICSKC